MARKSDTPVEDLAPHERREHQRFDTAFAVDYASGETFLFAYLQNISEMGIFIRTDHPAKIGTRLKLRFHAEKEDDALTLDGVVTWINPLRATGDNLNPGMGVKFTELSPDRREAVVSLVRTV